jgi:hypothetical protein
VAAPRHTTHTTVPLLSLHRDRRPRQYRFTAGQQCPSYRCAIRETKFRDSRMSSISRHSDRRACVQRLVPTRLVRCRGLKFRSCWRIRHLPPFRTGIRHGKLEPITRLCRFPSSVTCQADTNLGFYRVSHGCRGPVCLTERFISYNTRDAVNALSWAVARQCAWDATGNETMQRGMRLYRLVGS